jgi:hypothetical protein
MENLRENKCVEQNYQQSLEAHKLISVAVPVQTELNTGREC